jgi:phosphoribosyl-AMP cyclohydrolase
MIKNLKFNKDGLIPAIVQDTDTGEVLMMAYMNEEALRRTLDSGEAWFYSRSRQELWHKGETSGSIIKVKEMWKDCDSDTILIKGKASGPVCHTGNKTCFFQELNKKDIEG